MASNQKQEQKKAWSFGTFWKKPASNQDTPPKEGVPKENNGLPIKNISKNLEKFGSYAKNLAKEITTNVQTQLMTGMGLVDPVLGDVQISRDAQGYEEHKMREHNNQGYGDDSDEEEFDEEDQEGEYEEYDEEEDHGRGEGEEQEEQDDEGSEEEEEGYEEEEGSLEDEEEEEEETKDRTEPERTSMDDFAIDDDESPPIQHPHPDSAEKVPEEKKQKAPRKKKSKKKKTKKGKGKEVTKPQAGAVNREEQMTEDLVLEDVYVNRNYILGDLFTDFHQFYFKGDYLDYEPDEFFKATVAAQKTGITNMLFQETRYLSVQDNILYITEMETVEDYKLALVLESYPLSRLVKFERVDKKKRVVLGFYTDESNSQNPQREVTFEVKNYSKFVKVMGQSLSTVNSSFHLLSFNIE